MVLTTLPRGFRRIWPKIYALVCVETRACSEISPSYPAVLPLLFLLVHQMLTEADTGAVAHLTSPVTSVGQRTSVAGLERRVAVFRYKPGPGINQGLSAGLAQVLQLRHQQLLGCESHLETER